MKTVIPLLFAFLFFSCNGSKKDFQQKTSNDNSEFSVVFMNNYFPKNNIQFTATIKAIVISEKEKFDTYFGVAQTMENTVPAINFEKSKVVAIISKPNKVKHEITITETIHKDNKLQVKYKVTEGETQTFASSDLKIFEIPASINRVDFVIEK